MCVCESLTESMQKFRGAECALLVIALVLIDPTDTWEMGMASQWGDQQVFGAARSRATLLQRAAWQKLYLFAEQAMLLLRASELKHGAAMLEDLRVQRLRVG